MIVECKVLKSFRHVETGIIWFEGDTFKGGEEAAKILAGRGYLAFDAKPAPATPDLAALTVKELSAICAEKGVEAPKKARKADLIAAIEAAGR